ncbi:MAG: HepT-like ribonuclease domain-containing protein [Thermoanaerobaculia bacterium]|nr:HepT-like ribonuclease domain-containing protein [Thermoanaerobaculia bacterium]
MLDFGREALELTAGRVRDDFATDRQLFLACSRLAEIVGEAASRTSPAHRDRMPEIPWRHIVGFRNRLAHGYLEVDFDVLWEAIRYDFPPMIEILERFLADHESA